MQLYSAESIIFFIPLGIRLGDKDLRRKANKGAWRGIFLHGEWLELKVGVKVGGFLFTVGRLLWPWFER